MPQPTQLQPGDLAEHGRAVLATGVAKLARYNTHGPEDLLFGLGSGCEGTMDILLQRLDGSNDWQPLKRLALAWRAQRAQTLVLVVQSTLPNVPAGAGVFAGDHQVFGLSTAAALDPRTLESLCRSRRHCRIRGITNSCRRRCPESICSH